MGLLVDKYKCLNPYCSKKSSKLHIHHIDYNKKNCHPSNLITICNSCNSMANKDRNWHQTWYQAIIKNRYGGTS
jgi:5-methylcytosine-specific restriction endonuclease McrA